MLYIKGYLNNFSNLKTQYSKEINIHSDTSVSVLSKNWFSTTNYNIMKHSSTSTLVALFIMSSISPLHYSFAQNTTNIGIQSGTQGSNNNFFGFRSGEFVTGNQNITIGSDALRNGGLGEGNIAIGFRTLRYNTSNNNTALGNRVMIDHTSGGSNTIVGSQAMENNIIGERNVAIGYRSGRNNLGSRNVFIGQKAGENETGSDKLYITNGLSNTPLVFGDFLSAEMGINTGNIDGFTLAVGGVVRIDSALSIGTSESDATLTVKGDIHTQEVNVDLLGAVAPDFVFEEDYDLKSLEETEAYIQTHKHLREIPSASEMEANGIALKEMNLKLLQKVEELTLHLIEQNKINKTQARELQNQKDRITELERRLE